MVSTSSNVRVLARVRPAQPQEYQYEQATEALEATRIRLSSSSTLQSYESVYDCVLPDSASQAQVYSQVRQCVPSLVAGYNNTLMAYGQTGSGKTYTILADQT
ncbi:hypothetical protein OEZ86_012568 [Tetradesmus obliquus]|nr:hypothetical protein OEZ86_012568 [Tetradesmus obliquus]